MGKVTITFNPEKETPGTYKFMEEGPRDQHKVGTLYVKKSTLEGLGWKAGSPLTATLEA